MENSCANTDKKKTKPNQKNNIRWKYQHNFMPIDWAGCVTCRNQCENEMPRLPLLRSSRLSARHDDNCHRNLRLVAWENPLANFSLIVCGCVLCGRGITVLLHTQTQITYHKLSNFLLTLDSKAVCSSNIVSSLLTIWQQLFECITLSNWLIFVRLHYIQ